MKGLRLAATVSLSLLATGTRAAGRDDGSTLKGVRARGALLCGIDRSEAEYSSTDEHGNRAAFDRDLCKAVAIAVLGPGAHIIVTYYADDITSMKALADGKADLIASLSIRSDPEDAFAKPLSIAFTAPVLRDATGIMVLRSSNISDASQLNNKKVCYLTESAAEYRLQAWFISHQLDLLPFPFQEEGEMEAAFVTGNCTGLAGDLTRLAQTRASTGARASAYALLKQTFGDDALGMAYRMDDPQWASLLQATRNLLLKGNGSAKLKNFDTDPVRNSEQELPLFPTRENDITHIVGSYRDILERDLGADSSLPMQDIWELLVPIDAR